MTTRLAVGLMSGTSADGVTAALVELSATGVVVTRCETYPYHPRLKRRVLDAPALRAPEISLLNFELGRSFADAAAKISRGSRPFVIGSHGQTIWHGPGDSTPNTLQLAEPALIAERMKVPVVADFRPRDMAAGGQGAPLVPAFDLFLFGRGPRRAVVNVGGIANISIVGAGRLRAAFDTGPGNALMDEAVRRATRGRSEMDRGGRLAARGRVDAAALTRLLAHPYFAKAPPKSLDRTTFGPALLDRSFPRIGLKNLPDVLATLADLTACSLASAIVDHGGKELAEIVVSGGGALNDHLMRRLSVLLFPVLVTTTAAHGLPVMSKEAACFAWLAARALDGKPNSCAAATGARGERILGKIVPA